MKYTPSPIPDQTPCTTRHDWFNAWLKHGGGVESFKQFILDCFETCPDIPEKDRERMAGDNALEIISDVFHGRFKLLMCYPKYHIPRPTKRHDDETLDDEMPF